MLYGCCSTQSLPSRSSEKREHGAEAIEKALILRPDLIIIDFSMPVMNGLDASRVLLRRLPGICIIMLTLYDGMESLAERAGIHAFLPKHKAGTHLIPAALSLVNGKRGQPDNKTATA
jgi:CheY-like chemotaxis protein